jgi:hypothetical protein
MHFGGRFRCGIAACSFSAGANVRGAVAGNDGEMAEATQKLKTEKASSKKRRSTGSKKRSETGSTTSNETNNKPDEEAKPKRAVRGSGVRRLKEAADRLVALNCEDLADVLLSKAKAGKMDSTRMLVSLAEGNSSSKPPVKKPRRHGPTLAEQLAAEPEWTGDDEEGLVEMGEKGRE